MSNQTPSFDEPLSEDQQFHSSNEPAPKKYTHPVAVVFTLLFKIACLIVYIFLTIIFSESFIITFIIIVLLLAFDFYTMKNVSGRLLVGLRWWNEITEDGNSVWRFETKEDRSQLNSLEITIFWGSLAIFTLAWIIFAIKNLLTFSPLWFIVDLVGISLCLANFIGYFKCARAAGKLKEAGMNFALTSVLNKAADRKSVV